MCETPHDPSAVQGDALINGDFKTGKEVQAQVNKAPQTHYNHSIQCSRLTTHFQLVLCRKPLITAIFYSAGAPFSRFSLKMCQAFELPMLNCIFLSSATNYSIKLLLWRVGDKYLHSQKTIVSCLSLILDFMLQINWYVLKQLPGSLSTTSPDCWNA